MESSNILLDKKNKNNNRISLEISNLDQNCQSRNQFQYKENYQ
jgi:hypothetical protein